MRNSASASVDILLIKTLYRLLTVSRYCRISFGLHPTASFPSPPTEGTPSWPLGKIRALQPYYRGMSNALHPNRISPAERLAEIGRILAAGLIRMKASKSSALSADRGESTVDLSGPKSGHATRNSQGGMTR